MGLAYHALSRGHDRRSFGNCPLRASAVRWSRACFRSESASETHDDRNAEFTIKDAVASKRKVFIVDDHPIVREGLALMINREPDLAVCGDAEEMREAACAPSKSSSPIS